MRSRAVWAAAGLLFLVGARRAGVQAGLPARSDRIVDYTIEAELIPEFKQIKGHMDLVWRNPTRAPVDHLFFHLYLNAFRDKDSTFMREGEGRGKARALWDKRYAGHIEVRGMRRQDGTELWTEQSRRFVAPDDGNEKDRTLARVELGSPVAPGETIALAITWDAFLPRVVARTGWSGDPADPDRLFFMAAQWFPKPAVVRAGEHGEPVWDAHQFHRNTEFFADYGVYQVKLTVPNNYVVGATGERVAEPESSDKTKRTVVYRQEDVHDFAWTASPRFEVDAYTWSYEGFRGGLEPMARARLDALLERTAGHLGRKPAALAPQGAVRVRILGQSDHGAMLPRIRRAAGFALACFGIWFGPYPYHDLTIVDVPAGGRAAGGMEYPTLITIGADAYAPDYATGTERVTIHEFGHQFFYGLLGSNEFEEAWLDEGFTTFTTARVYETAYRAREATTRYGPLQTPYSRPFDPPRIFAKLRDLLGLEHWLGKLPHPWKRPASLLPVPGPSPLFDLARDMPPLHFEAHLSYPPVQGLRDWWLRSRSADTMVLPGWEYAARSDYAINSYGKPGVFLYCLRGLMGEAGFDRALRDYSERFRFKHPTTSDALEALLAQAPAKRRDLVAGFVDAMVDNAERVDVAILSARQREIRTKGGAPRWEWTIKVQRRGPIPLPIEIRAEDERGAVTVVASWQSAKRDTTRTLRVIRDSRLRAVRVGPRWLADIDADLSNNARAVGDGNPRPAVVVTGRWAFYVEEIVRSYAGLAR